MFPDKINSPKQYLVMSDFDQTLSFNDSGLALSELLGIPGFLEKVAGLSNIHLVQQGGELAYLLLHDPEFRKVRKHHLVEVGKRIRLKDNIQMLSQILEGLGGNRFAFYVISAAPQEVIQSALEGIVPAENIYGTQLEYDGETGEIKAIRCLRAGYGKVAVVEELRAKVPVSHDSLIYVGDGSSDVHVMLHVNRLDGLTIAVSENKYINQIARRTILSDNALSILIPMLEDILHWDSTQIRALLHAHGFLVQEWDKVRTDTLTISRTATSEVAVV
jgi:2-hydroxy-3-keto-5-methylthiopentenyl-1-phosphate phosphatase